MRPAYPIHPAAGIRLYAGSMELNLRCAAITAAVGIAVAASQPEQSVAADGACLDYEPTVVTLTGTITRHMEYGPPNYGEDPAHDAKEIYWYLELDNPICVNGKDEDSPEMQGETDVRKLQIVNPKGYPKGG